MNDHEASAYCKEKFRQYDEHIKESPEFRDKVITIEGAIGWMVKTVEEIKAADKMTKTTLFTIAMAIVMQIGGFIYLWGGRAEVVKRLGVDVTENAKEIKLIKAKIHD